MNFFWWHQDKCSRKRKRTTTVVVSVLVFGFSVAVAQDCTLFLTATNYTSMQGVLPVSDALGYLDVHDWVVYEIPSASYNEIEWRVASPTGEGKVMVVHAETRQYYTHLFEMPITGDWNNYQPVTSQFTIPPLSNQSSAVMIPMKLQILQGGFNLQSLCLRTIQLPPPPPPEEEVSTVPSMTPSISPSKVVFVPDTTTTPTPPSECMQTYQAARDYRLMLGMTIEGKEISNLAWLDPSDLVMYDIVLPRQGWYQFHFGVSTPSGEGAFRVELENVEEDASKRILLTISQLPATNSWYQYEKVSSEWVYLTPSALTTMTLTVEQGGWNFRWWCWDWEVEIPTVTPTSRPNNNLSTPRPSADILPTTEPTATSTSSSPTTVTPTSFTDTATGFVRAQGTTLRDPQDQPLLLRGVALGGWMAPNLVMNSSSISAREWWKRVETTVGMNARRSFQQVWLQSFVTKDDLQEIKVTGFNAIRVPLHYELFTLPIQEESLTGYDTWSAIGFRLLDQLMEWATDHELYVMLDLMAAPGGQGLDPITDFDVQYPSLWEYAENRRKTVALWQELARRYADHPWLAGYDLLSAVDWNFQEDEWATRHWNGCDETSNKPLRALYEQTISAIREVDLNHMIILAGNCWGTNHRGLLPVNDTNVALGFHLHGMEMAMETIESLIASRESYNVPVVMTHVSGELNESSVSVFQRMESSKLGWLWWTWKGLNTTMTPFQFGSSTSYNTLADYWSNNCSNIHEESALRALMQIANNTLVSKAKPISSVVKILLGNNTVERC
ncbi:hypothetical protein FisN_16Lh017 [Fistulifera solaris]|uniref:Glycoside hydrolase family 5 domain-containing protein n=1 Tax=Fistulifera solaris TaxID=1519565 RepID=A0A1Z5KIR8_FISSO|nr:hypothetical protein FisN_16Lh017 [Fistulifera solaris]|eukprot:GAX26200.1 hypothetical protein FisN_16Lh017 [Fistulifera solaris]